MKSNLLDNVCIVLVDCKAPANIGSTARCMMNTGLGRLRLVRPPKDPRNDAKKLAAGADDILIRAEAFDTLAAAVSDRSLVVGMSRHAGKRRKNRSSPRDMAARTVPLLKHNRVALVFGNEVNGLDMDDLGLCHEIVTIPSSSEFPSLNLSHAVMVIAYELFLAAGEVHSATVRPLATVEESEHLYRHLEQTLLRSGFLHHANRDRMMLSLRQLFGRANMDAREVSILRGILNSLCDADTAKRPI